MKKMITCIFLILFICCSMAYAHGVEVSCNITEKENYFEDKYFNYNGMILSHSINDINDFWWTGKEYIHRDNVTGVFYISYDMINWMEISYDNDLHVAMNTSKMVYSFKYWGGKYVIYDRLYESPWEITYQIEMGSTPSAPAYILDDDFRIISEIEFDEPITAMSYVGAKYYLQTQDYTNATVNFVTDPDDTPQPVKKVYVSEDAVTWTLDETLTEVPLGTDGNNTLLFSGRFIQNAMQKLYYRDITSIAEPTDINESTPIKYETERYQYIEIADDLYLIYDEYNTEETSFQISVDGVYWLNVNYPEHLRGKDISPETSTSDTIVESVYNCMVLKEKILFQSQYRLFEYDINELRTSWYNAFGDTQTYVELDNCILGFETAPVTENDRTLVPMRFLFEQMGAEVVWDDATQTATATVPATTEEEIQTFGLAEEKSVTFSVDNTTATVNGSAATMDVPARLINDKTMVPLRFLSENLGFNVQWDEATRTAIVTTE